MNFYQHHIGDYASLTGHLSPIEDLAYRRALERYYKTEAPLELDVDRVARVLRLAEYPDAVGAVLREFFIETAEGWRNPRADEEIERMREKQEVVEERDQHEKTRMQRHREKRAAMFAVLADVGVYPAFNAKTADLEAAMRDAGVTLPVSAASPSVTAPVTDASPNAQKVGKKPALGDAPVTPDVTPAVTASPEGSDGTRYGTGDAGDKPATASRARIPTPITTTITNTKDSLNTSQTSSAPPSTSSKGPNGHHAQLPGIELPALDTGIPDCPHQKIRELWAQLMPELQQPMKWTEARSTALRTRWREAAIEHGWKSEEEGLRFFAKLFRWCRKSPFLMGNGTSRTPGQAPFSLTLPWLLKAENCAKVQEGNYHPPEG